MRPVKSEVAVRDRDGRRARGIVGVRGRPFVLVWIHAEALVVIAPCDEELLEVRDAVELAVVQREGVHSARRNHTIIFHHVITFFFPFYS